MRNKTIRILIVLLLALAVLGTGVFFGVRAVLEQLYPCKYSEYVEYYAGKYGMDPYLLYTFIRTESGFDPQAHSEMDAIGLTQMTQETFEWVKSKIAADEDLTFEDLREPEVSIRFGSYYIYRCLERYDWDVSTAAAAYHSGWTTVDNLLEKGEYTQDGRTLTSFPYDNMSHYVHKIGKAYEWYLRLYGSE